LCTVVIKSIKRNCAFFDAELFLMSLNQRIKSTFWNIRDDGFDELHRVEVKPFEHHPTEFEDERVNSAVKYHNEKWLHNEVVVRAKNATVEPQYAYAVDGLRTIIGASIRTRDNLPSPIPMLKAKFLAQKTKLKKAILFDGSMGINYFHLLSDVLHKIYLLEKFTEIDCPLLVGRRVYSKPFFQFLITQTSFSNYDWRPIDEAMEVKELYIARPMPYGKELWLRTKAVFIENDQELARQKAIFINRKGTRHITNFKEIEVLLNNHSVDIIDPGLLNMAEQAKLFNSATHVIGIHGAGMTNVAFCNHENVKVLELCSNNRIGTQYYWLCQALGIKYDMMLGSEANSNQSFELNPIEFEKRLTSFLIN